MNRIITISREFGSGGREIGKRLADELKIPYYDREIITEIAKETGMTQEYINKFSETGITNYPFQFAKSFTTYSGLQSGMIQILISQQKVLKEIAKKGDCIIVGRGADVILKDYDPFNIFVYADMKSKIKRCKEKASQEEDFTDKEYKNKILKVDKNRRKYHDVISNAEWENKENYDLCINTSNIEIKKVIVPLSNYIKEFFGGRQ